MAEESLLVTSYREGLKEFMAGFKVKLEQWNDPLMQEIHRLRGIRDEIQMIIDSSPRLSPEGDLQLTDASGNTVTLDARTAAVAGGLLNGMVKKKANHQPEETE